MNERIEDAGDNITILREIEIEVSTYTHLPCLAFLCLALLCLVLPCLTLPYLTLPCLALPYLTLPCLALPSFALPYLTLPYLALPCLTLSCLASPCLPISTSSLLHQVDKEYSTLEKHLSLCFEAQEISEACLLVQRMKYLQSLHSRLQDAIVDAL